MLTVKSTCDVVCPVQMILALMAETQANRPIFSHHSFLPTQSWVLNWVRARMKELGKNPLWYTLRSFRQGASLAAEAMEMPEEFIRTSGGWKGKAMFIYRQEILPELQGKFAKKNLNKQHPLRNGDI